MSHHTVSFEHKEAGSFIWNISNTNKQLFAILGHMSHHTVSLNTKRHGASLNVSNTVKYKRTISYHHRIYNGNFGVGCEDSD